MRSGFTLKSVVITFAVVLLFYLAVFYGIEFWRQRKGPWELDFITDAQGHPTIVANQPALNISSVRIVFQDEQTLQNDLTQRVAFDRPLKPIPFGQKIYEDLTVLPGVVTFDFFGHEIELLPRVLIINRQEVPWSSGRTIELTTTNKFSPAPKR